jgi:hypothetical protein
MRDDGWNGVLLLVIETDNQYVGWTGSHRIAAAREMGFISGPGYVIDESTLLPFACLRKTDTSTIRIA